MDIREFIYKRIAELQGERSDRELSLAIGKSESYLQGLKINRALPSLDALVDICRYLNVTLAEFFHERGIEITKDEEEFYRRLKKITNKSDYEILKRAILKADSQDIHNLARYLNKYID